MSPTACALFGWDCPPPIRGERTPRATVHPVAFVSGIDGRPIFDWSAKLLSQVSAETGASVHHVRLPAWAPVDVRSSALSQAITEIAAATGKVNLVCYAVAGLDCRYAVSPGGLYEGDLEGQAALAGAVASITTIGTPHGGTQVANAALYATDGEIARAVISALLGPRIDPEGVRRDNLLRETLHGLTTDEAQRFNQRVIDAPSIRYHSLAGVSHFLGQPLVPSEESIGAHCVDRAGVFRFTRHEGTRDAVSELLFATMPFASRTFDAAGREVESPTDGMVAVASAKWGDFLGCIPADHYDVIGQFDDEGPDPITGFDSRRFYRDLVTDLAESGL